MSVPDAAERQSGLEPQRPGSVAETGLDEGFLIDLLTKVMHSTGLERESALADAMRLPGWVIDELMQTAKTMHLVQTKGAHGANLNAEQRYSLTNLGRDRAQDAFAKNEWAGPAPVSLDRFVDQAHRQSIRNELLTREKLERSFGELVIPEKLFRQLGPAANSGKSILLYGPPGNGKTSICNALCTGYEDTIYIPHAIEIDGQVITLYDPAVHVAVAPARLDANGLRKAGTGADDRYVAIRRPAVVSGGELTIEKLDLAYNTTSRVYEATLQLKAVGGLLIVDDFGRQRQKPQEFVNRLIVPLEDQKDFLALRTGRKLEVPFDLLVAFSTNIPPHKLLDEAGMRRMRHKILIDRPDRDTFVKIFHCCARQFDLALDEDALAHVLFELYAKTEGARMMAFHPKFLLDQVVAIASYEGEEPLLRTDFLDRAWENLYPPQ